MSAVKPTGYFMLQFSAAGPLIMQPVTVTGLSVPTDASANAADGVPVRITFSSSPGKTPLSIAVPSIAALLFPSKNLPDTEIPVMFKFHFINSNT